jgi:hypothetical protein
LPTPSSSTITGSFASSGTSPSFASRNAVPTVGCPAKGNSARGVKMRNFLAPCALAGGSTNTVSERLNSAAIACI